MTVVELSPGGGWYTEIFANYLHEPGNLIAAHFDSDSDREYFKRGRANFEKKMQNSNMYNNVSIVDLSSNLASPNSVDAVVTFRNLHNWIGPQMDTIFENSYKALKPGGIFGIVEHRANPGTSLDLVTLLKVMLLPLQKNMVLYLLINLKSMQIQKILKTMKEVFGLYHHL